MSKKRMTVKTKDCFGYRLKDIHVEMIKKLESLRELIEFAIAVGNINNDGKDMLLEATEEIYEAETLMGEVKRQVIEWYKKELVKPVGEEACENRSI